jgi:putative hemolysin
MSAPLLPFPWLSLILILALVALNGLLSMGELAIVSAREARLKGLAKAGSKGAQCALDLAADPGRFLSTVQSGITLIGVVNGAFSGSRLGQPVAQRLEWLGLAHDTAENLGFGLVIVVTTFVSLVIGELIPKQFALRSPEPIAVAMAIPMRWLAKA